jgi:aminopeptidase N
VYEKGSELVRMTAGRLGRDGFRRGMDRYFERNDGRAATIEDFLSALGEANGIDLSPNLAWYGQAGTPRLKALGDYDATRHQYTLTLSQHTPPSHGQPHKQPVPIPVKLALFGRDGRMLPLHADGQTADGETESVVVLDQTEQSFVFRDVAEPPVPSLLRGFSAPVILECDYAPHELALLLTHDVDGFNRWEAGQQLAARAFDALRDGGDDAAPTAWCDALAALFAQTGLDDALLASLLTPPGELELGDRQPEADPARIHALRQSLLQRLASRIGAEALQARYQSLAVPAELDLGAAGQGSRRLKRRVLELLVLVDAERAHALAASQYDHAQGMTDRLAALDVLVRNKAPQGDAALAHFRARYDDNALALDKWFMVQAQIPGEPALARVQALEADPKFTLKNPNRARALLGTFASANPSGFHRADGAGYALFAERLAQLDAINPQIAARLATAFNGWKRLEPVRREAARQAMAQLLGQPALSRNLGEILGNMLQD